MPSIDLVFVRKTFQAVVTYNCRLQVAIKVYNKEQGKFAMLSISLAWKTFQAIFIRVDNKF